MEAEEINRYNLALLNKIENPKSDLEINKLMKSWQDRKQLKEMVSRASKNDVNKIVE